MTFLTWAALAIGALVVAPLLAHLLRRRPPREQPFAAAALVPASAAVTQRRRAIEDRALFVVRALAVVALAVLGATPLLQCNRLSVARQGGASVALAVVLDDSLSMRAADGADGGRSRFERAKQASIELVEGLQSGDVVALVLAGAPSRVALAATTNLDAALAVLEAVEQTDRGTDLDGAVIQAQDLLRELPHEDRRVVLLSDLLAPSGGDRPLDVEEGIQLWAPLGSMGDAPHDCAAVRADWVRGKVVARVVCSPGATERRVAVRRGGAVLGASSVDAEGVTDVTLGLSDSRDRGRGDAPTKGAPSTSSSAAASAGPSEAPPPGPSTTGGHAFVEIEGDDAIDVDDEVPVLEPSTALRIGIVTDGESARPPTGGPPPIEQALAALGHAGRMSLLTALPDDAEALQELSVLIIDDAPGFAPEDRRRLSAWLDRGGVLVLSLGPRAGAARLGSGFAPMLPAVVRWTAWRPPSSTESTAGGDSSRGAEPPVAGIDPDSDDWFGETVEGVRDIRPAGRARLELAPGQEVRVRARWSDGQPFLVERRQGRGVALTLTLPLSAQLSDFPLRPAFLVTMERIVDTARTLGGASRSLVGTPWRLPADGEVVAERVTAEGEPQPVAVEAREDVQQVVPERLGLYRMTIDGKVTHRVAAVDERELLAEPRQLVAEAADRRLGGMTASVDVSRHVALVLLLLLAGELALRVVARRQDG